MEPKLRWLGVPIDVWDAVALSVGFAAVQSRFLFLPRIYDPIEYFFIASRLEDAGAFHRSLRIGLNIPVRLAQELFGYSEAAYYLIPFLAGVGLTVSVYYLGKNLFSRSVGLTSAGVVMISPLILSESAQLYPDLPSAAAFTGALSLVVAAGVRYRSSSLLDGRVTLMLVASGLLLGWAYLIREFIVILFPVAVLVVVLYRLPARALVYVGGAALLMFGAELAWGWWRYQDPLARLADLLAEGDPSDLLIERVRQLPASTDSALTKLMTFPRILGLDIRGILLLLLGAFGIITALITRDRGLVAMAAWSLLYWSLLMAAYIYLNERGFPILRSTLPRYWFPILPAFIVGGFGAIQVLLTRAGRTRLRGYVVGGVGVVLLALGVLAVVPVARSGTDPGEFHEFRNWLRAEGEDVSTIWTDQRTGWLLSLYTNSTFGDPLWPGAVKAFNTARQFRPPDEVSGGLMVYYDTFFRTPLSGWRGAVPGGFVDPAPEWIPAFVSRGSTVVGYQYDGIVATDHIATIDGDAMVWSLEDAAIDEAEDGEVNVDSSSSGQTVVTASPGNGTTTAETARGTSNPGAVRVTMDLQVEPGVWVEFECAFRMGDHLSRRVRGTTLYHPANESESVEYICAVPQTQEAAFQVVPRLVATGDGRITLGEATLDWFAADG